MLISSKRLPIVAIGETIAALVARRQALDLRSEIVEFQAGLADNHLAKIEAGARVPGLDVFLLLVETLGGEVSIAWADPRVSDRGARSAHEAKRHPTASSRNRSGASFG